MNIVNLAAPVDPASSTVASSSSSATTHYDDSISDADSGFGSSCMNDDGSEYATTVASELSSYVFEHGRRYQGYRAGTYSLPNDLREIERLEIYHFIFQYLLGGDLHTAPLKDPRHVLDVGCGAGEWAMNMAEDNPQAQVVGIDLSKIQPPWTPPNCRFDVDDAEAEFITDRPFDYIHLRSLSGALADWMGMFRRCYDHMTPGGYVEFQDYGGELCATDDPMNVDAYDPKPAGAETAFERWWQLVTTASRETGKPFEVGKEIRGMMEQAGFTDVNVRIEVWPMTRWPEHPKMAEISQWGFRGIVESLNAYSNILLTRILGWAHSDVVALCKEAHTDLRKTKRRYWVQTWFVYGKKPETS